MQYQAWNVVPALFGNPPYLLICSVVRVIFSTGAAIVQNTKKRPWLAACPVFFWGGGGWRLGACLYCEDSLKGLAISMALAEILSCKLMSIAVAGIWYYTYFTWCEEITNASKNFAVLESSHSQVAEFCYICFFNKFKASNTLLYSAKIYHNKRRVF